MIRETPASASIPRFPDGYGATAMLRILPFSPRRIKAARPNSAPRRAEGPRGHSGLRRATISVVLSAAGAAAGIGIGGGPAAAADDRSMDDALERCATIRDAQARLACFDAVTAAADAEETDDERPAGDETAAGRDPAQDLGREQLERAERKREKRGREEKQEVEVVVAEVYKLRDGRQVITLKNGQVWQEKSAVTAFRVSEGDRVTIREGLFGGYRMTSSRRRSSDVIRIE